MMQVHRFRDFPLRLSQLPSLQTCCLMRTRERRESKRWRRCSSFAIFPMLTVARTGRGRNQEQLTQSRSPTWTRCLNHLLLPPSVHINKKLEQGELRLEPRHPDMGCWSLSSLLCLQARNCLKAEQV